jgi:hypothetical protein
MVRIQAFKGSNKLKKGGKRKEYYRHFVIIPQALITALAWKKGDEVDFMLEGGKVVLRKRG